MCEVYSRVLAGSIRLVVKPQIQEDHCATVCRVWTQEYRLTRGAQVKQN